MSPSDPEAPRPPRPSRGTRRRWQRIVGTTIAVLGLIAIFFWVGVPLTADPPAPPCQPIPGVVRGVYHVHALSHDDRDRSSSVLPAIERGCLDFVVVNDHHGERAAFYDADWPDGLTVLDGAEWTRDDKHHHGQLVGVHLDEALPAGDEELEAFRVLNHPASSDIDGPDELSAEERALIERDLLGVEVRNVTRLLRTPKQLSALALAFAVGLGRTDLFLSALSLPGESVDFWVETQRAVGRSLPMVCGTDAHGAMTDYGRLFPASTLHLPAPPDGAPVTRAWVARQIQRGRAVCVNEHMGSPGRLWLRASSEGCALEIEADLPVSAHWKLARDNEEIARGRGRTTIDLTEPGVYHLEAWRQVSFGLLGHHSRLWALTGSVVWPTACVQP